MDIKQEIQELIDSGEKKELNDSLSTGMNVEKEIRILKIKEFCQLKGLSGHSMGQLYHALISTLSMI